MAQVPAPHTPTITVYQGLDNDVRLNGPGTAHATVPYDFTDYTYARLSCTSLSLTKSTETATEAETANTGADLIVHLKVADLASATVPSEHDYQIQVQVGGVWQPSGVVGRLLVRAAG